MIDIRKKKRFNFCFFIDLIPYNLGVELVTYKRECLEERRSRRHTCNLWEMSSPKCKGGFDCNLVLQDLQYVALSLV